MEQPGASDQNLSAHATHPQVKLCAVCKVDLRGRFVLADEEFERMLGYSQDDVFGRPLTDFAADRDKEIIDALLVQYSQYEPVHQTATITLLPANGEPFAVTIMTALNFVAGNAVNFQVLITQCASSVPSAPSPSQSPSVDACLALLDRAVSHDWTTAVGTLCELAAADECLVYLASDNDLTQIATSGDPAGGPDAVSTAGETTDLHWWVANAGEAYRFDHPENVQAALQAVAKAPTELLLPFRHDNQSPGLIRFTYSQAADSDSPRLAAAMDRAIALVKAMQTPGKAESTPVTNRTSDIAIPTLWPILSDHLGGLLADAVKCAEPLGHEHYANLAAKDKVQLARLQASLYRANDTVVVMKQAGGTGRKEKTQSVDLNLIVGALFERLQPELPSNIKLTTGDLPSIQSRPGALEQALTSLTRILVGATSGRLNELHLAAETSDTEIRLTLETRSDAQGDQTVSVDVKSIIAGTKLASGHQLLDQLLLHQALEILGVECRVPADSINTICLALRTDHRE